MKQLLLIVVTILTATSVAFAQPADSTSAAKVPVARRMYEEGVDAANKGRWSVAHDRFKASYDLAPRVLTLFNLAGAQGQTGRLVEAAESYRRFLRETTDGRYPDLRNDATVALETLEKQIAQVTLDIANVDPGDVIAIDDVEFPQSSLREPIPMNPGPHVTRVRRNDVLIATKSITLSPGSAESVRIELPTKSIDLTVQNTSAAREPTGVTGTTTFDNKPSDRKSGGGMLRSPWFWGAAVVVVAGAAVGAYMFTRSDDEVLVVR
jgi:hypothetical protein